MVRPKQVVTMSQLVPGLSTTGTGTITYRRLSTEGRAEEADLPSLAAAQVPEEPT